MIFHVETLFLENKPRNEALTRYKVLTEYYEKIYFHSRFKAENFGVRIQPSEYKNLFSSD